MRFATTMKRSDSCSPIGFPLALWALLSLTFRRRQTSQIRCYYLTCARCALEPRWVFPYLALSIGRCCLLPGGRHRLPHIRNEAVSLHAFALRLRTLHCLRLNLTSRLRLQGYVLTARYGFVRRRLSLLCNNNAYWRTPRTAQRLQSSLTSDIAAILRSHSHPNRRTHQHKPYIFSKPGRRLTLFIRQNDR